MNLQTELYENQLPMWPKRGKHILAQGDDEAVVVYQAYRPKIAEFAVEHQRFGGEFSFSRMSWIKPNFLWMMFRSGWATKEGQEAVLAIKYRRSAFLNTLSLAVHSKYIEALYGSAEEWKRRSNTSGVRLQWDPDHGPTGAPVERRAIQLGLSGEVLVGYGERDVISIEDITPFVREQHEHVRNRNLSKLLMPRERPMVIADEAVHRHLGLDEP
jgi:hypothetical protein